MNEFVVERVDIPPVGSNALTLFLWRGNRIVLLGEFEQGRWILARGWLLGDSLEHIRRWSFAQPLAFSGQVRRLVMEASHDAGEARHEGLRALAWAESLVES